MQFLAAFVVNLLKNPVLMSMVVAAVQSEPEVSPELADDFSVVASLGTIWAQKEAGTVTFVPDNSTNPTVTIVHVAP